MAQNVLVAVASMSYAISSCACNIDCCDVVLHTSTDFAGKLVIYLQSSTAFLGAPNRYT